MLTAPDARTVPLSGPGAGRLRLVYSASQQQSTLVGDGLADVPADHAYAMWFIGGDGPALGGLFRSAGRCVSRRCWTGRRRPASTSASPSSRRAARPPRRSAILYSGAVG